MTERRDQVEKLLGVLHRHSELVSEAFDGELSGDTRQRAKAIESLFEAGALKPYDEDTYRLNPRLREFIADHLSSYHAYQSLRGVSGTLRQANAQWRELRRLKEKGTRRNVDTILAALDESIADIAYSIEHNLAMLYVLLGSQFGNVVGLQAKIAQNAYYAAQVVSFLRDMEFIRRFVERVDDEAIASGLSGVRTLISRRLGSRLLGWTGQLKDAQAAITRRLFDARRMEARLKNLSNFALWLDRNKTTTGWEFEGVDLQNAAEALWRPGRIKVRPQPDVGDSDVLVSEGLARIVGSLPPPKPEPKVKPPPVPQRMITDEDDGVVIEEEAPHERALRAFISALNAPEAGYQSLATFKRQYPDIADLDEGAWLMYGFAQLQGSEYRLEVLSIPISGVFVLNEPFYDILVKKEVL